MTLLMRDMALARYLLAICRSRYDRRLQRQRSADNAQGSAGRPEHLVQQLSSCGPGPLDHLWAQYVHIGHGAFVSLADTVRSAYRHFSKRPLHFADVLLEELKHVEVDGRISIEVGPGGRRSSL